MCDKWLLSVYYPQNILYVLLKITLFLHSFNINDNTIIYLFSKTYIFLRDKY